MARKKKIKENQDIKPTELEKEIIEKKKENDTLKEYIKEREQLIKKLEELEAKERILKLKKYDENDENEEIEQEPNFKLPIENEMSEIKFEPPKEIKPSKFEELLKRFNENNEGTIEIYRIQDGKEMKICKMPVKEYGVDLDNVAKRYGGGEYKLRLRNPDGTFAGEITEYYDELAYPRPKVENTYIPPIIQQPQQDLSPIMNTLYQIQRENQKMMMDIMSKVVEGISQRNQFINSIKDIVELKELLKNKDDNPIKSIDVLLTTLMKGIELGKIQGEIQSGNEGNEFLEILKMIVPTLSSLKSHNNVGVDNVIKDIKQKISQPQIIQNPPEIKQIENQEQPKENPMRENLILKMYKPFILQYAKENKNPHDVAVQIFSKIPEQYFAICYDFTLLPTRVDEAINFIPELKDYRDWVDKVLEEGKKLFEEYFKEIMEQDEE